MSLLHTLLAFLVALALLIFVHELGHYLVARWCGVKVLRFSIGFGRPIARWTSGSDRTEWCFSLIPLGGYVKMLDEREADPGSIDPAELGRAFNRQSVRKRTLIVAAGPLANFLLAVVLYAVLNWSGTEQPAALIAEPPAASAAARAGLAQGDLIVAIDGDPVRSWDEVRLGLLEPIIDRRTVGLQVRRDEALRTLALDASGLGSEELERDFLATLGLSLQGGRIRIGSVLEDSPAARAGLRQGDVLLTIDGAETRRARDLIAVIQQRAGQAVGLEILRDGARISVEVVPQSHRDEQRGVTVGRIGAVLSEEVPMVRVSYGAFDGVTEAAVQTWDMSLFSLRMLGKMVVGDLSWRNLSGPVTIADYAGRSASIGWQAYLGFMALISVSLGVLNLLPIPVLDGGHLVYYAFEAVRGRPLSDQVMLMMQRAGLGVIAVLMTVALFNDITRLFGT